jgi:nuclear pore complex protein Nup188
MTANARVNEVKNVLADTWSTIRTSGHAFEQALASGDIVYYRTLLKILFLSLFAHLDTSIAKPATSKLPNGKGRPEKEASVTPTISIVLEILERVVAGGFRQLASAVHDDNISTSSPEDIALITAILQTCLRIPGIEHRHTQITHMFAGLNVSRTATALFSWSDTLAIDGDPIYGELSMLFLVELSSVPPLAEHLAVDGVLAQLSTARITDYLRRGGSNISPVAEIAGSQRVYAIWTRGFLPLCLNLLFAVGAPLGPEIAAFLNQFTPLLTQSAKHLEAPDSDRTATTSARQTLLTLPLLSEVHSTALILYILTTFRTTGVPGGVKIPEVQWDAAGVLEDVEFWRRSRLLKDRVVATSEREARLAKEKAGKGGEAEGESKLVDEVRKDLGRIRWVLTGGEEEGEM